MANLRASSVLRFTPFAVFIVLAFAPGLLALIMCRCLQACYAGSDWQ